MPELQGFGEFHFLRPTWLWLLLLVAINFVLMQWRASAQQQWTKLIAPHLLDAVLVGRGDGETVRPEHLITALMALGILGVAGPTWERERSPFAQDTAPLVIALDLSATMDAVDVQPSRLERSKQKARDLLETRRGSRSALIVYAGTAHSVLPLSDDPDIFAPFLGALETNIMPVAGKAPAAALQLAAQLLAGEDTPGSIVFITDGISSDDLPAFEEHAAGSDDAVLVLAVGTSNGGPIPDGDNGFVTDASGRRIVATLDREGLEAVSELAGVFVVGATVDNADVERLQRRVRSNLQRAQQDDTTSRWRDSGYWLTLPVALLGALWFRRGWTVRWNLLGALLLVGASIGCAPGVWWSPDQQGRRLFEAGEYAAAAEVFQDPLWQGVAYYEAKQFDAAIGAFSASSTPEAAYNMGNALTFRGNYEQAVASYDQALLDRPDWVEARENRDLVQGIIDYQAANQPESNPGVSNVGADEVVFDNDEQEGEPETVEASRPTDTEMSELWMRRLQTSPADFLRRRFAVEAARSGQRAPGGDQ